MTKLLAILGSIGTLTPSVTMAFVNPNIVKTAPQVTYQMSSFTDVIKIINSKYGNPKNLNVRKLEELVSSLIPSFYADTINDTQSMGDVIKWKSTPRNDKQIIDTFEETFINTSDDPQECLTHSKTTTVTQNHEFSISLSEKMTTNSTISVKGKIMAPIGGFQTEMSFNIGFEAGSVQKWSDSKKITVEETVPSQKILQRARTILHVSYVTTKGTYDHEGIARFKMNNPLSKSFRIPVFYFDSRGDLEYIAWKQYSSKALIKELAGWGYGDQLQRGYNNQYSVFSVDDLNNPKDIYVNLPIKWTSEISGFELKHYQENIDV